MNQLRPYQSHYLAHLKKKLWRKRISHLKKMIQIGKTRHQESTEVFTKGLFSNLANTREHKINCTLALAEVMIKDHLASHPQSIVFMLKKLLKNIAEHADVEISAHPSDASVIKNHLGELNNTSVARKMIMSDDSTIKPGSLVIKANKSIIDAHLHTQMGRAKELLLN